MELWYLLDCFPVLLGAGQLALNQVLKAYGVARREVKVDGEICWGQKAPGFWHTVYFFFFFLFLCNTILYPWSPCLTEWEDQVLQLLHDRRARRMN